MAGIIQQSMGAEAPQEEQQPMGEMPDDETINEDDPAFKEALGMIVKGLYEGGAAEGIAEALQSEEDPVVALGDNAYKMLSIVTDAVDVDAELLPLLAIITLQEIAEIGEAAGMSFGPNDVAEAFKMMLLQTLEEAGMDPSQLEQAMAEVDPSMFEKAAADEAPGGPEDAGAAPAQEQPMEDDTDEEIPA